MWNCLLKGNAAAMSGGGVAGGNLYNCTVVGNQAAVSAGGVVGGSLHNGIVYGNAAPVDANCSGADMAFSCTTPNSGGTGNIDADPQFVNAGVGTIGYRRLRRAWMRATTARCSTKRIWTGTSASSTARWTWGRTRRNCPASALGSGPLPTG